MVANLTSQLEGSQSRDSRMQNEKIALQRQIEALNDQLVRAIERCDALSEENRKVYLVRSDHDMSSLFSTG